MKPFIAIAVLCTLFVLIVTGINMFVSESASAQNIMSMSLNEMQVMYGGDGDLYRCVSTGGGACDVIPQGGTCNENWSSGECEWSGSPSFYCEEWAETVCTSDDCLSMQVSKCCDSPGCAP